MRFLHSNQPALPRVREESPREHGGDRTRQSSPGTTLCKSVPSLFCDGVEASAGFTTHTRLKPRLHHTNPGTDLHHAVLSWARRVTWVALLGILALALVLANAGAAQAQEVTGNKAGVVVDFGDGVVVTACVDLGADGQATGEELLHAASFDVLIEYSSQGGAVCKINAQGCNYPDQQCWCQCMSSPCVYWAYHHLAGNQWQYATQGASTYVVHSGEVDGWAWGAGTVAQGAQPPLYTFDQICAPPTATPSPTPTATSTATSAPTPTLTPTAAATIWVPWPTSTPTPTALPDATATPTETAGPQATATTASTTAATASSTPTASLTPAPPYPTGTATPGAPIQATATPGVPTQTTVPPSPSPAPPTDEEREQAQYLPFIQHDAGDSTPGADGPARIALETMPAATVVITTTLAPTATVVAASSIPPAAGGAAGPAAHLARGRAVETSSDASRLQNAPFSVETEATLLTRAAPDPVWPVLLTLVLAAALAALRAVRRAGLRSVAMAFNPRTVVGTLSRPVASLRKAPTRQPQAANAGPRASFGAAHSGLLSLAIYGLTAGIGLLALLQPFLSAALGTPSNGANASNAPLLVTILMALCFLALLFEIQGQAVSAKMIALLGVLVAINSVLRFVEVSIPGPGGFTPVFFLIVLTGYVFGGRFGFLMGALTMLVSSLITGGVGPWLPGQMFTAGWMGLIAPLARPLVRLLGGRPNSRTEVVVLAGYAGLCGLFYGVVINLWFWPFMTGPADQYWQAGVSFAETVQRYALYYTATSLLWDVFAVAGNLFLVAVFGAATLRALRRFHQRFEFEYRPVGVSIEPNPADELPDKQATPVAKTGLPRPAMSLSEG